MVVSCLLTFSGNSVEIKVTNSTYNVRDVICFLVLSEVSRLDKLEAPHTVSMVSVAA